MRDPSSAELPKTPLSDAEYAAQLAAARAEMPAQRRAKMRWLREQRSKGKFHERVIQHAFWGRDVAWWKYVQQPLPDPEYLQGIDPGWMWVRIDGNTKKNYVTSDSALNLDDPAAGLGAADWHQTSWWVPLSGVHPRARDCAAAERTPLCGEMFFGETWKALGDIGVIDIRPGLRKLGHPAGRRAQPVWGANHVRAIIDQAWSTMRIGVCPIARHVTPALVARWLWRESQFEALEKMALAIENRIAVGRQAPVWRAWREPLKPEATWHDTPVLTDGERNSGDSHAPAP